MASFSPPLAALKPYDRLFILRMVVAFAIGLGVITLLQVASFIVQQRQIEREADTAALLNLGGAQRMKSQRVAMLSMALLNVTSEATREKITSALLAETAEMARIHQALVSGDPEQRISGHLSTELKEIFFGADALDVKMRDFIATAERLARDGSKALTPQNPELYRITESSTELLELLRTLTNQYRREGDAGIEELHRRAENALIWTLIVVLLVVFLIFYPIVRRLKIEFFERSKVQEELTEQNQELEQFAALVAHDLKAPLNNISGFGQFLKSKLELSEDHESIELAEHIELGVRRMSQMITELLKYARLSRGERAFVPINLSVVIRKVMSDFELLISQSKAQIKIGSLPEIMGDRVQIEHLFHNLIGNAIKYRHAERSLVIEISEERKAATDGRFCSLSIKDNGRGFPEESVEQMFQPFKRLNATADTEGSGFGLALCKKIVKRHHGTIVAKNVPAGGACFTVTLPRA